MVEVEKHGRHWRHSFEGDGVGKPERKALRHMLPHRSWRSQNRSDEER
jgi:hypothetical protein